MKAIELIESNHNQTLDKKEFIKLASTSEYKWYFEAFPEGAAVYRGSRRGSPYKIVDPSQSIRRSANTTNEYTQLVSKHPAWSEYPRRSKSIICTTSANYARDYGKTFAVILPRNFKVGVCPEKDWWDSFSLKRFGFHDMSDFNYELRSVLNIERNNISFKKLKAAINGIMDKPIIRRSKLFSYLKRNAKKQDTTPIDILMNEILSPEHNDFKLATNVDDFNLISGYPIRELWTGDKCLMVSTDQYKNVVEKVLS